MFNFAFKKKKILIRYKSIILEIWVFFFSKNSFFAVFLLHLIHLEEPFGAQTSENKTKGHVTVSAGRPG